MIALKIIIFGAGKSTKSSMEKGIFSDDEIVAIVDNDINKQGKNVAYNGGFLQIKKPDEILSYNFEIIIVSILDKKIQIEVIEQLRKMGVPVEKIGILCASRVARLPKIEKNKLSDNVFAFMDTTCITDSDYGTGTQRVTNSLYREFSKFEKTIVPVRYVKKYITSYKYKSRMDGRKFEDIEYEIKLVNKKILFPDTSWEIGGEMLSKAREDNANIYTFIYDLIPIRHHFHSEKLRIKYVDWMNAVLQYSDNVICISKTVANDLIDYFGSIHHQRDNSLAVYVTHLGYSPLAAVSDAREQIKSFCKNGTTFLMVGTVEPRKNHLLALQAMKKLVEDRDEIVRLIIIGKDGWMNEEFKERYRQDDKIRERVLWIHDATDSELSWLYTNCDALLFPSSVEGFGLPLIEAAQFNLPILCSDIPIFREIAGEYADYFQVDSIDGLCQAIVNWLSAEEHPASKMIPSYSWQECAMEIKAIMDKNVAPYRIM